MEKIRQNNGKIVIGTPASVEVRYKGQEYVIRALSELKKKGYTNFEYQLAGAGDNSFLKNLSEKLDISEQVKFLGSLPHDQIFDWLKTIDIYSQPSKQEGLPRALIEAMSQALPSFGARTAGIPELLDSKYIFKHGSNSYKDIADILMQFDKKNQIEQAQRNYEESKKYDQKVIANRRRKFYEKFRDVM
ncbi:glycosyltransferase family 4 protein [Aerococcus urinaeequi]|uniref:glycosyltransferase family 4 protein n=1 Tax=Aerococcus urinaeequi TaxID=51665 RepID=UPI003D6ADD16